MRRCTISGLIPLMASARYGPQAGQLLARSLPTFQSVARHKSYYLLRELPPAVARQLVSAQLPALLDAQQENGLWRARDAERATYDILALLQHIGAFGDHPELAPRYCPLAALADRCGFDALRIKRHIYHAEQEPDRQAAAVLIDEARGRQGVDGAWAGTVVGTAVEMERLLDLGVAPDDPAMAAGVSFLFAQLNADFEGLHTSAPYGLTAHQVFSTEDRRLEFEVAAALKPEWLPRNVCFRTMAVIPNSVCLALLIRLGLEQDPRVAGALDSLYQLYDEHGGLCASDIKKPYL